LAILYWAAHINRELLNKQLPKLKNRKNKTRSTALQALWDQLKVAFLFPNNRYRLAPFENPKNQDFFLIKISEARDDPWIFIKDHIQSPYFRAILSKLASVESGHHLLAIYNEDFNSHREAILSESF
jgi:hypothetical protein